MLKVAVAVAMLVALTPYAEARGRGGGGGRGGFCNVCGCKGGPGYRAPDGKCVGRRNITKLCGSPPSTRCKKESLVDPRPPRPATAVPNPFS